MILCTKCGNEMSEHDHYANICDSCIIEIHNNKLYAEWYDSHVNDAEEYEELSIVDSGEM